MNRELIRTAAFIRAARRYLRRNDLQYSPWPSYKPIGGLVLLDSESVGCIRFAFLSALVDSPYVDDAIAGLDAIIQFLEGEGFQP